MSSAAQPEPTPGKGGAGGTAPREPVTLPEIARMKAVGQPIVMVTAYDYPSARIAEEAGVDLVLVGDTAAMVVLGYPGTEPVSMDEMVMLGRAVRRGVRTPLMVGDMPMGSYEASDELAVQGAQRLVKETGCQAVKLESGGTSVDRARAIVRSGIPVIGHVGLTPQTATALGGYKAQARTADGAVKLREVALALEKAGCFAIVFEAVPAAITEAVAAELEVPTIGIGAGPSTDGQVLVFHDLVGLTTGPSPRFVKRYAGVYEEMLGTREAARPYLLGVAAHRTHHLLIHARVTLDKARRRPGSQPDQIVEDQDLPVGGRAGPGLPRSGRVDYRAFAALCQALRGRV